MSPLIERFHEEIELQFNQKFLLLTGGKKLRLEMLIDARVGKPKYPHDHNAYDHNAHDE